MSAQNDTAFLRMFLIVLGALVAFTVIILIAATRITGSVEEARGEDPRVRAAIAERIKPIGTVNVAGVDAAPAAPAAAAAPKSGAEVAAAACNACHVAGVLGAPKIGDKAAWEQRLAAQGGVGGLTTSAINGKGSMPARGGAQVSDVEIRAAVEHMLSESGVEVAGGGTAPAAAAETAAPAAPAPAEAAAAAVGGMVDAAQSMAAAVMPEAPAEPAATAEPAAAPAATADLAKGKSIYGTACFACHATGAAGAPKLDDKAAWAPRIAQGMDTLVQHAINGKGAMPPKGGRLDLSDDDIRDAVAYMVGEAE